MNFKNLNKILILVVLIFFFYNCKQGTNQKENNNYNNSVTSNKNITESQKVKKLFYNVPSPLEMASSLSKAGVVYKPELLNKLENKSKYLTIQQLALNFGVYGADLSFARLMDKVQEAIKYLAVIRKISDDLGIPQGQGVFTINRLEENIENKDSVLQIISDTYYSTDSYLKNNERADAAAMIVLGGWVEAIYIATNVIDEKNPDKDILNCIAEQKYSLNNLIDLINEYKENKDLNKFAPFLLNLKTIYDKIEITCTKNEVINDKQNKTTTIKSKEQIVVSIEQIKEIKKIIGNIRKIIIQ